MVWRAITGLVRVSPLQQIIDQCADDGSANAGAKDVQHGIVRRRQARTVPI